MKKLSCFALVVALVLAAGAAFALPIADEAQLAPYAPNAGQEFDMFTISGDYLRGSTDGRNDADAADLRDSANKWLQSADVHGFTIVVSTDDEYFTDTASMEIRTGNIASSADLPKLVNVGPGAVRATGAAPVSVWADDWFTALVRTTKNAVAETNNPVIIPLSVFVYRDRTDVNEFDGFFNLANGFELADQCSMACCGVNYALTCCTEQNFHEPRSHELRVWFDVPERAAVYCCGDLPLLFKGASEAAKYDYIASVDMPLTVARLNDVTDMVRVRLVTNSRNTPDNPTNPGFPDMGIVGAQWNLANYLGNGAGTDGANSQNARTYWFHILQGGRYTAANLCTAGALEFWPNKFDFNACEVSPDRYWWRHDELADVGGYGFPEDPFYDYAGARDSAARIAAFNFWRDKDLITQADIAFGETLNLGVWYGGAVDSDDAFLCMCTEGNLCDQHHWQAVPRVTVQNLGTTRLDVIDCHTELSARGICATDCGLCDTMPNGYVDNAEPNGWWVDDAGVSVIDWGFGGKNNGTTVPSLTSGIPGMNGPGIYFQNDAGAFAWNHMWGGSNEYEPALQFRWGDFWYWDGTMDIGAEAAQDVITLHCPCYIYPAFTKTLQPMANRDFDFSAEDGTSVKGRWNTSYILTKLVNLPGVGGTWCRPTIEECSFLFVYFPCCCEADTILGGVEKNVAALKDLVYTVEQRNLRPVVSVDQTEVVLEYAAHVLNDANTAAYDQVPELIAREGDKLAWYNTFNVFEVTSPDHAGEIGILPVQLRFTIPQAAIVSADFSFAGDWRSKVWDTWTLKTRNMNGEEANIVDNLTVLGAPARTTAKSILDWQTMVVANTDEIRTTGRVTPTNLTVYVTAFIVDAPAPAGTSTFTYLKLDNGNEVLFIFDGRNDHQYQDIVYIAEPSSVATFAISPATFSFILGNVVSGEAQALNVPGGTVDAWTVSPDNGIVSLDLVSGEPNKVVVKGLAVGSATVYATAGVEQATASVVVAEPTVTVTPTSGGSSSGGGCNAGAFAPLMLLLVAPVVLLLKK